MSPKRTVKWVPGPVEPGFEFATPFEKGCIASEVPDWDGYFSGTDSDGVEVLFHVMMVIGHPQHVNPIA